jgi:rare lipoprotein A
LVAVLAIASCLTLLLFAAGLAKAEQWVASWYGPGFEGATTASGEPFDPYDYTAAHRTLPFGTKLIVTFDGRSVVVRVNDRGPYVAGRDLDLSQAAAEHIGLTTVGLATVDVDYADPATPTGPYTGRASAATPQAPPAVSPAPDEAAPPEALGAADQQYRVQEDQYATQDQQAAEGQYAAPSAVEAQYAAPNASADQYAGENMAPRDALPLVAPPAPGPAELEIPPAELVVPASTVERRIQLGIAAPPPGYAGPLPNGPALVERQSSGQSSGPEGAAGDSFPSRNTGAQGAIPAGMTTLPETGGLPLIVLVAAAAVICGGLIAFAVARRS